MKKQPANLVLIDAMALAHRAYHAIPHLTSPKGELVNAVYGFASTLLHVIAKLKADYLAVVFDEKGPTFRHTEFADYKLHRPAPPDDLINQFPIIRRLVKAFDLEEFSLSGFEADDLIGTLAYQAAQKGVRVIIVTGDQDFYQLISKNIQVYNVARGTKKAALIGQDEVMAKYGISPQQLVDYKALRGDPTDNIPGVAGIGEKTALKLIQEFGNIENLFQECESSESNIKATICKKLCANQEKAFLSKRLATIDTQAPVELDLKKCRLQHYNEAAVRQLFEELGFKSLLNRLPRSVSRDQQSLF